MTETSGDGANYDYVIIGGGNVGLNVALLAAEHGRTLVVDKGQIDDGNSGYAPGSIAAAVGLGDSATQTQSDTLANRVRSHHRITVAEHTHVTQICTKQGAVTGAVGLTDDDSPAANRILTFHSPVVVICSTGAGQLYRYTTNPGVATGDGVALAYLAGADVMDMEFYQFHPTALRRAGAPAIPLPDAMRVSGATLRNANGRPFVADYHPMADLALPDAVSRAIAREMERAEGQPVMLDLSHLSESTVTNRFPTIYAELRRYGLDMTREPIPVAPAAHYMIGGVKIDTWGRTGIKGLFACGEAACAEDYGASLLAGNSLPDALALSRRVVEATIGNAPEDHHQRQQGDETDLRMALTDRAMVCATVPERGRANLQDLMWRNVGVDRNGTRLLLSARILNLWQRTMAPPQTPADYELRNMLVVSRLITEAALQRRESRGAHYRADFTESSPEWERHIVLGMAR